MGNKPENLPKKTAKLFRCLDFESQSHKNMILIKKGSHERRFI